MRKIILFIPLLALLSSCGTEIPNLVNGKIDNSSKWEDNYYTKWDEGINDIDYDIYEERNLNDNDMVFTNYNDPNFIAIVGNQEYNKYNYYSEDKEDSFGLNKCLSNYSENFKKNFTSKLFDGKLMCYRRYEKVRVQIKESGIGINFHTHTNNESVDYFAIQFKSALNFKQYQPDEGHKADIDLKISFYSNPYGVNKKQTLTYLLKDVKTNGENYTFFGFTLANVDMNHVYGCSVEYTLVSDEYNDKQETPLSHALLIYEIMMPNSIWR